MLLKRAPVFWLQGSNDSYILPYAIAAFNGGEDVVIGAYSGDWIKWYWPCRWLLSGHQ